jgi:hypothetical protein
MGDVTGELALPVDRDRLGRSPEWSRISISPALTMKNLKSRSLTAMRTSPSRNDREPAPVAVSNSRICASERVGKATDWSVC